MTKTTKDDVIKHILNTRCYEDVLVKYLSSVQERNEFRQELWLILLEISEEKLIHYYDTKCLFYVYIGIINNQIKSKTSPWHKKFRSNKLFSTTDLNNVNNPYIGVINNQSDISKIVFDADQYDEQDTFQDILDIKQLQEDKLKYIEDKLEELLKNDPKLIKEITVFKLYFYEGLSYSQITKRINIKKTSVFLYVNLIKNKLIEHKHQIKITDPILC